MRVRAHRMGAGQVLPLLWSELNPDLADDGLRQFGLHQQYVAGVALIILATPAYPFVREST